MAEIEDVAEKIAAAFEDLYFVPGKKKLFNSVFNRYLPMADPEGKMVEPYDAIVELGYRHREEYDKMVAEFKKLSII